MVRHTRRTRRAGDLGYIGFEKDILDTHKRLKSPDSSPAPLWTHMKMEESPPSTPQASPGFKPPRVRVIRRTPTAGTRRRRRRLTRKHRS